MLIFDTVIACIELCCWILMCNLIVVMFACTKGVLVLIMVMLVDNHDDSCWIIMMMLLVVIYVYVYDDSRLIVGVSMYCWCWLLKLCEHMHCCCWVICSCIITCCCRIRCIQLFRVIIQGDYDVFVASWGDDFGGNLVPHAYRCCV